MYTPTKFSTVADKERFFSQFKRFVESDFQKYIFPKWFYTQLSMCFGMIAHYNQEQFYETYFTNDQDKLMFLNEVMRYPCYGDPQFTYYDVEGDLQIWIRDNGYFQKYLGRVSQQKLASERAEYERLKAKFERSSKFN